MHGDIWIPWQIFVTILRVKAEFIFNLSVSFLFVFSGLIAILFGNLGHDLIESICADSLYALLLVDLINRHPLVLQSEEEEHKFVNLLLVQLLLLFSLCKSQPQALGPLHEIKTALR